jgi:tRNA isopentenyl-2-thiomethyl-A-37 hydroxylase MiaE
MNTILTVAALIAVVTAYEIVRAIVAHVKAKNEIKLIEAKLRAEEARKSAAEMEEKSKAAAAKLASTMSTLTEEQLAAYNRALEEMQRPTVQYVPGPPFYQCYYGPYGVQPWRGW